LLFIGDFFQLPSIGLSLWKEAVDMHSSVGHLVRSFQVLQFISQLRAQGDLDHSQMLNHFRDLSTSPKPMTASVIQRLKVLSSADISEDPSWMTAPMVVTNNLERLALIKEQVVRFSILHAKPVIAWRLALDHTQNTPTFSKSF